MLERIANYLKSRGKHFIIKRGDDSNKDYLERFYLWRLKSPFKKTLFAVFIHCFWSNDPDPLHDHPWNNISIVLKGGYWEHLYDGSKHWRKPGYIGYRKAEDVHRVELEPGTEGKVWTLFIHFKRRRKWGFWYKDGWRPAPVQSITDH